jgi:hypothetical protein
VRFKDSVSDLARILNLNCRVINSVEMAEEFSRRYRFRTRPVVAARDSAPKRLREALLAIFERNGYSPEDIGEWICQLTRKIPEEQLGADPTWYVVSLMMNGLDWYTVFDLLEKVCPGEMRFAPLAEDINACFEDHGIPWKIVNGVIEERGDDIHEHLLQTAIAVLGATRRPTASAEIKEAIAALSGRPEPDVRGAVSRAIGAVEALVRDLAGDSQATLGQLAGRLNLPTPLEHAITKLWGYASEEARHVREGQVIKLEHAHLVVNICAALTSFLGTSPR